MTTERIVLSNPKEFELRGGVVLKVYPASLETISQLDSKIKKLENMSEETSLKAQSDAFVDVVYDLVKEDNDVKKAELKKILTMEACTKILQSAVGSFNS